MSHQAPRRIARHLLSTFLVGMSLGPLSACDDNGRQMGPAVLREIPLTDQHGEPVLPERFADKLVLVNLMFTHCPSVCPRITRRLVQARESLSPELRKRIQVLSLTVDPENDTPAALNAFAVRHHADVPGWQFVRTSEQSLQKLTERLMVFEPGAPQAPASHSLALYLFDGEGHMLQRYDGASLNADRLATEIAAADVREQSK